MRTGYTKLYTSILESTIWQEDKDTRLVWITLLALADADGIVQGSIPGIAGTARVSLESCKAAIAKFMAPDPYSRSTEANGRRLRKIDGGWLLVTHGKHRNNFTTKSSKEKPKERTRRWRNKKKSDAVTVVTPGDGVRRGVTGRDGGDASVTGRDGGDVLTSKSALENRALTEGPVTPVTVGDASHLPSPSPSPSPSPLKSEREGGSAPTPPASPSAPSLSHIRKLKKHKPREDRPLRGKNLAYAKALADPAKVWKKFQRYGAEKKWRLTWAEWGAKWRTWVDNERPPTRVDTTSATPARRTKETIPQRDPDARTIGPAQFGALLAALPTPEVEPPKPKVIEPEAEPVIPSDEELARRREEQLARLRELESEESLHAHALEDT
jgi:hypothetical protein